MDTQAVIVSLQAYMNGIHCFLEQAAAAYDKAALYMELRGGPAAKPNFPSDSYEEALTELAGGNSCSLSCLSCANIIYEKPPTHCIVAAEVVYA